MLDKYFKLDEYGTTVSKEVIAGLSTFFAMSYILAVNPAILSDAGLPYYGVYIATILAAVIGTGLMGIYANIPYAQAPGMGLNAFFTYTVVIAGGFTPFEALGIVLISGLISLVLTFTGVRKQIFRAIPRPLQNAIGGGIGLFVAYIGFLNIGFVEFNEVPSLALFNDPTIQLALFGVVFTLILMLKQVQGAILIGLLATTLLGIPLGVVDVRAVDSFPSYSLIWEEFSSLAGKGWGSQGVVSLFKNHDLFTVIPFIFAASLTDTFDTVGTLIGTGRRSGIFTQADEEALLKGSGSSTRLEKGFISDITATIIGSFLGTTNVTTFTESAVGIGAGGKTGLTSVVTALMFLFSIVLAPVIGLVPAAATAPALIIVGILMSASFAEINWNDFTEAIPAFTTIITTVLTYSISNGIAFGFITYIIVKVVIGEAKKIHPIIWISATLFVLNFIFMAYRG